MSPAVVSIPAMKVFIFKKGYAVLKQEQIDQISLINYIRWKYPGTKTIISPIVKYGGNQVQRLRQGALIKKMGYVKGTLDIFIPKARGPYHGLFIELKSYAGRIEPEQTAMAEDLRAEGYCAVICHGYAEAVNVLDKYMAGAVTNHL